MNAVDTNVLLYVHDPRDVTKQASAANLLQSLADGVLLWQVACEYLAASRKLVPFGYNLTQAYEDVRDLQRVWFTLLPSWSTLDRSGDLGQQLQFVILGCHGHRSLFGSGCDAAVLRRLRRLRACGRSSNRESF
jgi:predicted nucleic acid-binding protein